MAYTDPFGDTLQVVGSEAYKKEVQEIRIDQEANEVFNKLEASTTNFALVEGNLLRMPQVGGYSFDTTSTEVGDWRATPEIRNACPRCRGIAVVDPVGTAQEHRSEGMVTLHEAIHLSGIADRGRRYADRPKVDCKHFGTEVRVGGRLKRDVEPSVAAACHQ